LISQKTTFQSQGLEENLFKTNLKPTVLNKLFNNRGKWLKCPNKIMNSKSNMLHRKIMTMMSYNMLINNNNMTKNTAATEALVAEEVMSQVPYRIYQTSTINMLMKSRK
jgi:hypothetical protein